jgi:hypothetical protein
MGHLAQWKLRVLLPIETFLPAHWNKDYSMTIVTVSVSILADSNCEYSFGIGAMPQWMAKTRETHCVLIPPACHIFRTNNFQLWWIPSCK